MRLSLALLIGCASGGSDGDAAFRGPGQQEWTLVPTAQVATECGLDPALLEQADAEIGRAYAVVRYGKLCHEYYPTSLYPDGVDETEIVFSAAKNIGSNNQERVWNAIRPALVALDPTYACEKKSFRAAYAAGDYAPSL